MIPSPVIRRLPRYLGHVQKLRALGVEWTSSGQIANSLALTSSTVRQDLSHVKLSGIAKRGYHTETLERVLRDALGCDEVRRLVIVGAGRLGAALAENGELQRNGFETCGIFDRDRERIGEQVGPLKVQSMRSLRRVIEKQGVTIGIIAVPADAAQAVADQLILAGAKALLNLAYTHLQVPAGVTTVNARILESLQELAFVSDSKNQLNGSKAERAG